MSISYHPFGDSHILGVCRLQNEWADENITFGVVPETPEEIAAYKNSDGGDTMLKDWYFSDDESLCHFRTAGVLIRDGKIFLQKVENDYSLPGGQVSHGETSANALVREFREETGAEISCGRLLWVAENFWMHGSKKAHEISFYYLVSLNNDEDLPENFAEFANDNKNVLLEWVSIEDLQGLTLYPTFLKAGITNLPKGIEHLVINDRDD